MSSITSAIRLVVDGDSKGAQKALHDLEGGAKTADGVLSGAADHSTSRFGRLRDAAGTARAGLKKMFSGDIKSGFSDLGRSIGGVSVAAVAIGTAVVAGVVVGVSAVKRLIEKYIDLGKQVGQIGRITGMGGDESNSLRVQFKMLGMDVDSSVKSLGKFGVALGTAQTAGTGPAAVAFERLGIGLRDQNDNLRTNSDVLSETRDKLAGLKKENLALYQLTSRDLFGKGYLTLDKWLGAAITKVAKFKKIAGESTVNWNDKSLTPLLEDTREMSIRWEDIKATIGQALSGPVKKFMRVMVEQMPTMAESARKIAEAFKPLGAIFEKIGKLQTAAPWLQDIIDAFTTLVSPLNNWVWVWDHSLTVARTIRDVVNEIGTKLATLSPGNLFGNLPNPLDLIPGIAAGGYVPPRPGGTLTILAEGGEGEDVVPASKRVAYARRVLSAPGTPQSAFGGTISSSGSAVSGLRSSLSALADAVPKNTAAIGLNTQGMGTLLSAMSAVVTPVGATASPSGGATSATASNPAAITSTQQRLWNKQYKAHPPANAGQGHFQPGQTGKEVARARDAFDKALDKQAEFVLKRSRFAKRSAGSADSVLVTGNTFVGTSRDAERTLTNIVSRRLGPQTARLGRGRFAGA